MIRYKGSAPATPLWTGALAPTLDPAPQRTREQAIALATQIASEAQRDPTRFTTLAAKHSDDLVSGPLGGVNGIHAANTFAPHLLDALAVLKDGQVSEAIESENGFHVLRRAPLGEVETIALSEVVVGYDGAPELLVRPGRSLGRTRVEAKRIAAELYEELRSGRLTFDDAVAKHSDAESAMRGGDIGVWSTHDAPRLGRELAVVRKIAIGELTAPIESGDGYRILRRDAPDERPTLAVEQIMIAHRTPSPDDESTAPLEPEAHALAERILFELRTDPGAFERYQREHCCVGEESWLRGRGAASYEARAQELAVGMVSTEPFHWRSAFFILKRVEPSKQLSVAPPRAVLSALANPATADLDAITENTSGEAVEVALQGFSAAASPALGFDADTSEKLGKILGTLGSAIRETRGSERRAVIDATWREVRALLGDKDYARFQSFIAMSAEKHLMAMW